MFLFCFLASFCSFYLVLFCFFLFVVFVSSLFVYSFTEKITALLNPTKFYWFYWKQIPNLSVSHCSPSSSRCLPIFSKVFSGHCPAVSWADRMRVVSSEIAAVTTSSTLPDQLLAPEIAINHTCVCHAIYIPAYCSKMSSKFLFRTSDFIISASELFCSSDC